ncbi:hypothetical protein Tco_0188582 [Tanacetum coccineum]
MHSYNGSQTSQEHRNSMLEYKSPDFEDTDTSSSAIVYTLCHFIFRTKVTGQNEGTWGFEHIRKAFKKDVIPFVKSLRESFTTFDQGLFKEINEMNAVFNQIETEVEQCSVDRKCVEIQKKELLIENERLLEQIIFQDIMCSAMHADVENKCVLLPNEETLKYAEMEQRYIDEYSRCVELKAEFSKKKDMVERDDDPEFQDFFEINDLKAQLQKKDTTISNLKDHIAKLKGKSVSDCTVSVNNLHAIAPGMFKLDLEPLSPKLSKNREAHIDYLKQTKEHADTLCEIVKQARALKPLDNTLDYACKFTTRI